MATVRAWVLRFTGEIEAKAKSLPDDPGAERTLAAVRKIREACAR
jgi:hypothetical protein